MKKIIFVIPIVLILLISILTLSNSSAENTSETGFDATLFIEGALSEDITTEDCTLSDGTETTCYSITVTGTPANHDVGPFCPRTTSDTSADVGIWLDGDNQYDVDGEFILNLAEIYEDTNWKLYNDDGTVNYTETAEAFEAAARPDVAEEYQNHCVEGQMEWLDGGTVSSTVLIPTTPVPTTTTTASDPMGVTLNGVVIAPAAPVAAILGAYTIAAFDDCGGHINPTAGYHLHGNVGCGEVGNAVEGETAIFAYAMDGYPVHSALETASDLDTCNGHTTDELGYHYHAGAAEGNSVLSCFTGAIVESAVSNGGGNRGGGGGGGGPPEGAPLEASAQMESSDIASLQETVEAAAWSSNVALNFSDDSFTFTSDGLPSHGYLDAYLAKGQEGFSVAEEIQSYDAEYTMPLNPVVADEITATPLGAVGVAISGAVFFNPYEGGDDTDIYANDDNAIIDGIPFIDACGGHGLPNGSVYHYHGIAYCISDALDVEGEHSRIAGYMFDGFPIYGPQDVNGVAATDLDECNSHFGPTPEYPEGIQHYHTTETAPYMANCYVGEVTLANNRGGPGNGEGGRPDGPRQDDVATEEDNSIMATEAVETTAETIGVDTTTAIESAAWSDNVSITIDDSEFRYESNGLPSHDLPEWFLIPIDVSTQPFSDDSFEDFNVVKATDYITESPIDVNITLNPTIADETTDTSLGQIGVAITGASIFNDYEDMARSVSALDDNISFTIDEDGNFDEDGHDHAAFVDDCNGHPLQDGSTYHYHGVPVCITADIDVEGQHSSIVGVLQDGFPIYGNKGIDGAEVTNADLDDCSGHVEATPEFPNGIYHYHLTLDEAPYMIDCYTGVVSVDASGPGGDGGPGEGGAPDFSEAAATLGVTEDALTTALGRPPFDLDAAAETLGVSIEDLEAALPAPPQ